jgi:hypothetical protein
MKAATRDSKIVGLAMGALLSGLAVVLEAHAVSRGIMGGC